MKKRILSALAIILLTACAPVSETAALPTSISPLPAPVDVHTDGKDACTSNRFAPICSAINPTNLKDYLGRKDVLYIDLRDYEEYADIHFRNFECIPYRGLIFGTQTSGEITQLYSGNPSAPTPTYRESDHFLEKFFPRNKTIFLLCRSGRQVAEFMTLLAAKNYDMSKIYNITGISQYVQDSSYADYLTSTPEVRIKTSYSFERLTGMHQ